MTRPAPKTWKAAILAALALTIAALLAPSLEADTVFKKDGGKLRGEIVEENEAYVKIKAYGSVYTIQRSDILRIERDGDIHKEYEARVKKLKDWDEKGWLELGLWSQENDLGPEAIDCFYEVIRINPDNAEARWELGHRQLKGKWVPAREYYEAKGYVRYQGMWVTAADKAKYDEGLVKDRGEWITREEYQKRLKDRDGGLFDGGVGGDPEPEPAPPPSERKGERKPAARNPFGFGGGNPFGLPRQDVPETEEERTKRIAAIKARDGWGEVITTEYYDIFTNGKKSEAEAYGQLMDKACSTFKKIFAYEKDIVRSFPVYMHGSQQEFMSKTGRGQGVGGYYTSDGMIVSFHSPRAPSTLLHEGTHQFQGLALGQNMWTAKIWFIEGLAVYFEGSKERAKDIDTSPIPKDRLASVKRAINGGTHVPISQLIRMEQREFGALHYAHAWSLIYFFVNGTKGGRKRFKEYFEGVKEGRDGQALFEECFDKPLPVIEEAWIDFVKRLK